MENAYLREHGAKLYPGVKLVLQPLKQKGFSVGIASNSQAGYIEAFLAHYQLEQYVDDHISYGDTEKSKAENIKILLERNQATDAVYVGDTQGDFDACLEAGVVFIWASYGFGQINEEVPKINDLLELMAVTEHFF